MTRSPFTEAHARLHDQARERAYELRREAIDDFWRGASHVLADSTTQALRSSARLLARWRHHRRTREAWACGPSR
mgnify:CR=1 FL=1